jgi:hypothetical protein
MHKSLICTLICLAKKFKLNLQFQNIINKLLWYFKPMYLKNVCSFDDNLTKIQFILQMKRQHPPYD